MTNRRFSRALLLAVAAGSITFARSAGAAPPTKDECVEAHSRGQDARDKNQLSDAKRLFLLCAQTACPALLQSDCAKFGDELSRTAPSVSFVARDGKGADLVDTQVFVDGVLAQSRLDEGKSHDLDPGKHTIRFVHAGKEVTQAVVISAGEKSRAIVAVFGEAASAAATPLQGASPPETAKASRPIAPLLVAGLGGAAMVVGGVLLATGLGAVPANCSRDTHECAAAPGDAAFDDAKSAVGRANIGLGVGIGGAVVVLGGLIWYFSSSPSGPERTTTAAAITPWTDGRGGGAAWHARF